MRNNIRKGLAIAFSAAFIASAVNATSVGNFSAGKYRAETNIAYAAEQVSTNNGRTTDFVDYWWGGSAMSSVLNENGETIITLPNTQYGHRMNNGKDVNGTGTDIYTAEIDFTMSTGILGFFSLSTSGSQYLANESLAICIHGADTNKETGATTPAFVSVGLSHENYDHKWNLSSVENVHVVMKNTRLNDEGGIKMQLTVNDELHEIEYDEAYLQARFGSVRALDEVFGGWEGTTKITVHNYTDSLRKAYLEKTQPAYDGIVTKIQNVNFDGISSQSGVEDLVEVKKVAVELASDIDAAGFRLREASILKGRLDVIDKAVTNAIGDNTELATLVGIAANIEVFAKKVNEGLETKDKTNAAEALKQAVDLDALNDIIDTSETYATYAGEIKTRYTQARTTLGTAKDALVLKDIVAFENAVIDLSSDEKMVAAGDAKNVIVITDALNSNQEAYTARVNAAAAKLSAALKNYAGKLADSWEIYNVTFMKENADKGIDLSFADYYDDDPNTDVGVSFKQKFQLDGFSINFGYNGPTGANVWVGLHFFSELDVMHISDTDAFSASTGITTLIIPKESSTEFQMGYPKLYGNCPAGGWPSVGVGTLNTNINVRFAKEGNVYNCYVTMGEGEEGLLCSMDAEVLETYLVDGYGYLNMGYCDKDLNTGRITINKINGKNAAELVAKVEPEIPDNPDSSTSESASGTTTESVPGGDGKEPESKRGCGGSVASAASLFAVSALAAVVIAKKRKED